MATSPMVGGADPAILKSLEAQTPSVARTSPATVNAVTGAETSTGGTVSRGLVPQVSGGTVTYNQATQATAGNSVTVTSSTSNDPGDVVTIYTSPKAVSVSSVNQTVNTYKVNNYAGNEYSNNDVANYLPTFTGNVGAGNVNVTGGVYTFNLSSTGLASLTTLTVSATSNLGAVGNVRITGGTAGQVLSTNGSGVLSWVSDATTYGNSNVVSLMGAFGSNTISTTGLITGNGGGLSNVPYANVTGTPTLGNISTINLDGNVSNLMTGTGTFVAIPTVPSFGNIATINLDGNVSNLMTGTGTFVAIPTVPTVGNIATINLDGNSQTWLAGNGVFANIAIPSVGNIATINLDGNVSNLLTGTGTFVAIPTVPSFGNIATINLDGNVSNLMTGTGTFVAIPTVPTVGNIATINLDGNVSNVLRGDGTWGADANSAYGDSNVVTLLGAFGSNTIVTTGNANVGNLGTATAIITTGNITTINSGLLQNGNSNITITSNGNVSIQAAGSNVELVVTSTGANVTGTLTSTGKIGYTSGSTVTQSTGRGNGVTINAIAGTIITTSAAMVANEIDTFSVINSSVDPTTDIVLAQIVSPNLGTYNCIANPAVIGGFDNGFYINIVNISGFTTSDETITIRFMVIKAPNA